MNVWVYKGVPEPNHKLGGKRWGALEVQLGIVGLRGGGGWVGERAGVVWTGVRSRGLPRDARYLKGRESIDLN